MKKKLDKVRAEELEIYSEGELQHGMFYAHLWYDVKKLRRIKYDDLVEILFEKTLKLYPFAIVDKNISYLVASRRAMVPLILPLSPDLRITKTANDTEKTTK